MDDPLLFLTVLPELPNPMFLRMSLTMEGSILGTEKRAYYLRRQHLIPSTASQMILSSNASYKYSYTNASYVNLFMTKLYDV